jgi:hypothetical protein
MIFEPSDALFALRHQLIYSLTEEHDVLSVLDDLTE